MDAISSIGSMFSGGGGSNPIWQTLLKLGSGGAGAIGNILASNKRNQVLNQSLTNQKQLMDLSNNPTLLASKVGALEKPLSAGLTSSVGNAVQGYLAERGLSQSPGIASETLAQGLAPYQLQEQQMAMQTLMQSLGLPAQATPRFLPYPQSTDLSKIFQSLFKTPDPMTAGGNNGITTGPNLSQLGTPPTFGDTSGGSADSFNWMQMLNNGNFDPSTMGATA